jgi:hypothetical protein
MLRALVIPLFVSFSTCTLRADFIFGEPNDAYHWPATLSRKQPIDEFRSNQVQPKGRATLDATMTTLVFEDLAFNFPGTYAESYDAIRPDPFTPPRISAVHPMEALPYSLRVTEPLVFDVEYQWPLRPVWKVTSAYDTRDEFGVPHPELLTMVEVNPDSPKPDKIIARLEPVWRDAIIVDYEATLFFEYNLGLEHTRYLISSRMSSAIPAPGIPAGDATRDGRFDSQDLVHLFQDGRYEQGSLRRPPSISLDDTVEVASRKEADFYDYNREISRRWSWGDFNDDLAFDSSDLVLALQTGRYEQQPAAILQVPEPTCSLVTTLVMCCIALAWRRL